MDCTSDLYPDTLVFPYGDDDGDDQRHLHLGFECHSLVVRKSKIFFEIDKEFESMMAVVKVSSSISHTQASSCKIY